MWDNFTHVRFISIVTLNRVYEALQFILYLLVMDQHPFILLKLLNYRDLNSIKNLNTKRFHTPILNKTSNIILI